MPLNCWTDSGAAAWPGELGPRVYTSRLLGRDPDLVLHGGGNTSVKIRHETIFGEEIDVLVVKGSGADLADVDETSFAWLDLDHVRRLAELEELSDREMASQLAMAAIRAGGPAPSVEAILHAVLPYRVIDHTHADAVVTLTNTPRGAELVEEVYGGRVVVVPYVMPGFRLARACAERVAAGIPPEVEGMVLLNHGIFTWGTNPRDSYDRMIELVGLAEDRVAEARGAVPAPAAAPPRPPQGPAVRLDRAELRRQVSTVVDKPVVVRWDAGAGSLSFARRSDLADVSQRGTVTPEHVIRTKPWPMLGRDVDAFVRRYEEYVERHRARATVEITALDPAPRVVLDADLGMGSVGRTAADASVVAEIYRHTMKVILDASALGGYRPISPADLFDVEYWELEQAKLTRRPEPPPFAGEVALVTGAAGGIGRACAGALMAEGASVAGLDVDEAVAGAHEGPAWLGLTGDVTDPASVEWALDRAVERFGGLDVLVLNAGVFPAGARLADLDGDEWRRVMALNLDSNQQLLRAAYPLLRLSPQGARVVVVGSKNVPAPGPGAAAYSASKAALTQLARVAALEWGGDGIRVNVIHPNAVFDTRAWSDGKIAARAASYGWTVEQYRAANVMGVEVRSADVARMCVAMCGPAFARTTGAQVPVDGGNDRVI